VLTYHQSLVYGFVLLDKINTCSCLFLIIFGSLFLTSIHSEFDTS